MTDERIEIGPLVFEYDADNRAIGLGNGEELYGWNEVVSGEEWQAFLDAARPPLRPDKSVVLTPGQVTALEEDMDSTKNLLVEQGPELSIMVRQEGMEDPDALPLWVRVDRHGEFDPPQAGPPPTPAREEMDPAIKDLAGNAVVAEGRNCVVFIVKLVGMGPDDVADTIRLKDKLESDVVTLLSNAEIDFVGIGISAGGAKVVE